MRANKNWDDLMTISDILFTIGYTVSMRNSKRWSIQSNDYQLFNKLPDYKDEIRLLNNEYLNNLDCFYTLIQRFITWSDIWIKPFTPYYSSEKTDLKELIKPYCIND